MVCVSQRYFCTIFRESHAARYVRMELKSAVPRCSKCRKNAHCLHMCLIQKPLTRRRLLVMFCNDDVHRLGFVDDAHSSDSTVYHQGNHSIGLSYDQHNTVFLIVHEQVLCTYNGLLGFWGNINVIHSIPDICHTSSYNNQMSCKTIKLFGLQSHSRLCCRCI